MKGDDHRKDVPHEVHLRRHLLVGLLQVLRRAIRDKQTTPSYIEANRKTVALSGGTHVAVDALQLDAALLAVRPASVGLVERRKGA